jgi:hypothetical protein
VPTRDEAIADLRERISAARWPSRELVADRSQGVQLAAIQELARYWATDHNWRECEAVLNALPQFTSEIDGVDVHFIHVKSPHENAMPLIMTHGWSGSVIELLEVVGPLTDPTAHGGRAEDAFDLVLPSLPGYGFQRADGGRLESCAPRPRLGRADASPRLHRPRGRRRSAMPCWTHPSRWRPGCSTTTQTATRRSRAPFSGSRSCSPPRSGRLSSRCADG